MAEANGNSSETGNSFNPAKPCAKCDEPDSHDDCVQCGTCRTWYHYGCVGYVDSGDEEQSFNCDNCKVQGDDIPLKAPEDIVIEEEEEAIKEEEELLKRERELFERKKRLSRMKQSRLSGNQQLNDLPSLKPDHRVPKTPLANSTRFVQQNLQDQQPPITSHQQPVQNQQQQPPTNPLQQSLVDPQQQFQNNGNSPQNNGNPPPIPNATYASFNDTFASLHARHLASRHSIPKELPEFSGKPSEWPMFISAFNESTEMCGFSNGENMIRLQKALKGKARELVKSLLNIPACVPDVISNLQMIYGRPEYILDEQLTIIRKVPAIQATKLETVVTFSIAVRNFTASMEQCKLSEHLYSSSLLRELVERLPYNLTLEWLNHRDTFEETNKMVANIFTFSTWLKKKADQICTVKKMYHEDETSSSKPAKTKFSGTHNGDNANNDVKNQNQKPCGLCKGPRHESLGDCKKFTELPIHKRWSCVKNFKLCRICLKGHRPYCDATAHVCKIDECSESHHALLHKSKDKSEKVPPFNGSHLSKQKILCRIIPVTFKGPKTSISTYAFLDNGSTVTLVDNWLIDALGVDGETEPLHLQWTGGKTRLEENSKRVELQLYGSNSNVVHTLKARSVDNLELPEQSIDSDQLKSKYKYLQRLPIPSYSKAKPRILIGLDNGWLIGSRTIKEGKPNEPIATKCRLGWSVEGPCELAQLESSLNTFTVGIHVCGCNQDEKLHDMIKSYYELDRIPNTIDADSYSMEDKRAERILKETVRKIGENRYESGLLWKYDNFDLPDSRPMAIKRHLCLEKKLNKEPIAHQSIVQQVKDYLSKAYIRKLSEDEIRNPPERVWYLPVFCVINPKKPNRPRIVFDGAATVKGISLNTMLLKGPDLTASLFDILLRFRQKRVGMIADVSEMFHQVRVRIEDQGVLRFVFRDSPDEPFEEYALQVLPFGTTCSPCIAQYVKLLSAEQYSTTYPAAAKSVKRNSYVDDELECADTDDEAIKLAFQIKDIFADAGFNIRNWRSNSDKVEQALEPKESMVDVKQNTQNLDVSGGDQIEKVLGMFWNTTEDCYVYSLKYNKGNDAVLKGEKRATKRELLKIQMSIYDPLGLIANFIVQIKILLQDVWRTGYNWDDELNDEHQKRFEKWLSHLPEIETLKIPRCYLGINPSWDDVVVQLHDFVDAGDGAYASVIYIRMESNSGVECRLVSAKTRVAPVRLTSIPRLELEAARLGARHVKTVKEALDIPISRVLHWTDSKTVLCWLDSDARSNPAFVAHRVADIQDLSNVADWRYVPSSRNAADIVSKQTDNYNISYDNCWYRGPEFLWQPETEWPQKKLKTEKSIEVVAKHNIAIKPIGDDLIEKLKNRYSSWRRLTRVVAWMIHFRNKLQAKINVKSTTTRTILTAAELQEAENLLYKISQYECFKSEITQLSNGGDVKYNSMIIGLNPYLDEHGLLRSDSRTIRSQDLGTTAKRPLIMSPRHWVTKLIVHQMHEDLNHINHETVVNNLRHKFWIPTLREVLKRIRTGCNQCRIITAKPNPPLMAPLPPGRVNVSMVFTHTGVDCFGPIMVVVGRTLHKRYGVLFTCLATRAINVQIMHSMTTDSLIMAIEIFISQCGRPRVFYCDNGLNFVGAKKVLGNAMNEIDWEKIQNKFVAADLEWKFNPPLSPHMGGAWERMIRSVKTAFYAALPTTRNINDEVLKTTMAMAVNTVNSRPLTYIPIDEDGEALTPNHFLKLSGDGNKPLTPLSDDGEVLLNSWKRSKQIVEAFWRRWVTEYLPTLTRREKWQKQVEPLKVGDVVIIVDKNLPRSTWPKGRVISINIGENNQTRSATVQTASGMYTRPTTRLAKLDILTAPEHGRRDVTANTGLTDLKLNGVQALIDKCDS